MLAGTLQPPLARILASYAGPAVACRAHPRSLRLDSLPFLAAAAGAPFLPFTVATGTPQRPGSPPRRASFCTRVGGVRNAMDAQARDHVLQAIEQLDTQSGIPFAPDHQRLGCYRRRARQLDSVRPRVGTVIVERGCESAGTRKRLDVLISISRSLNVPGRVAAR